MRFPGHNYQQWLQLLLQPHGSRSAERHADRQLRLSGIEQVIHPFQNRALTPREGARLQGLEDSFMFRGTRSQTVKQIGNAVPPLLGQVIAQAILDQS